MNTPSPSQRMSRLVSVVVAMIRAYQACLRPLLIGTCKFCPSCSDYAVEALQRHGLRSGLSLAVRRLIRCHPFSPGGIDPVPTSNHRNR